MDRLREAKGVALLTALAEAEQRMAGRGNRLFAFELFFTFFFHI